MLGSALCASLLRSFGTVTRIVGVRLDLPGPKRLRRLAPCVASPRNIMLNTSVTVLEWEPAAQSVAEQLEQDSEARMWL